MPSIPTTPDSPDSPFPDPTQAAEPDAAGARPANPGHWPRRRLLRLAAAGLAAGPAALLLSACGGGNDRNRNRARLRLVNASAYVALDLRVDSSPRQTAVAYGETALYVEVDPSEADTEVMASGSSTALQSLLPSLSDDRSYTLLATGAQGALRAQLLDDNLGQPEPGRSRLRLVHGAPDAGAVDVYLTAAGDSLASAVPLRADLAPDGEPVLAEAATATWRLRVTAAGSKTDVRLDLPAVSLAERGTATLVLTATPGGALVNALLLVQQGGITRADVAFARVRVVAGLAQGGVLSAQVGSTLLMDSVGSPAVGLYAQVPSTGAALPVTLAVDGTALASAGVSLQPGADYTLMLSGSPSAPRADWLIDDNRRPVDGGRSKLRLVHGLADFNGTLSLTADFLPVANGVLPGRASGYGEVQASNLAQLAVGGAGQAQPVFQAVEQVLQADGVYSLFVVGTLAAPVGILRRDR